MEVSPSSIAHLHASLQAESLQFQLDSRLDASYFRFTVYIFDRFRHEARNHKPLQLLTSLYQV